MARSSSAVARPASASSRFAPPPTRLVAFRHGPIPPPHAITPEQAARLHQPDSHDAAMTEAEARAALRAFVAVGEIERWIAEQPWEPMSGGGWRVRGRFQSWRFRVVPDPGGVGVVMSGMGGEPTAWIVPGPGDRGEAQEAALRRPDGR
jgi:hypothetical protein